MPVATDPHVVPRTVLHAAGPGLMLRHRLEISIDSRSPEHCRFNNLMNAATARPVPTIAGPIRITSSLRPTLRSDGLQREVCLLVQDPSTGKILVGRKAWEPPWCFRLPTGGAEVGESLTDAAIREAREEIGVDAILLGLVSHVSYASSTRTTTTFLVEERSGSTRTQTDHELIETRWVSSQVARGLTSLLERNASEFAAGAVWASNRAFVQRVALAALGSTTREELRTGR